MKQPKNQRELLQLLTEQDKHIVHQDKQIKALKQALLRLEQQVRRIGIVAERAQGGNQRLTARVNLTEKLTEKILRNR